MDLNITIADLRDRITFQSPIISKSPGGGQVTAYANVASNPNVWALVVYDHGQTIVSNEAEKAEQRATVTIRYRIDVSDKWQVLIDGNPWKIISPPDHVRGKNRWTVFRVERVTGTI
jgi:SPP1 family predicted phage head-tail adaptor